MTPLAVRLARRRLVCCFAPFLSASFSCAGDGQDQGEVQGEVQGDSDCPTSEAKRICHSGKEQCQRARQAPDMELTFWLYLDPLRDGGDRQLEQAAIDQNWTCLLEALDAQGLRTEHQSTEKDSVEVLATYSQLRHALTLEGVTGFSVSCGRDECAYCWELSTENCVADPFCGTITAARINHNQSCALPYETVGCMSSGVECTGAVTFAAAPDGECHQFSSGCIPVGWSQCSPSEGRDFFGYFEPCSTEE